MNEPTNKPTNKLSVAELDTELRPKDEQRPLRRVLEKAKAVGLPVLGGAAAAVASLRKKVTSPTKELQ